MELTREQLGYWHDAYSSDRDLRTKDMQIEHRIWFETDKAEFEVWIAPDSRCLTSPAHLSNP